MIQSMTGFGSREAQVVPFGKVSVELRSSNHKFLEVVFHLPEGFISLEDKIKKEIEARIKRGRVTCVVNVIGASASHVSINKALFKNYLLMLRKAKKQFQIKDEVSIDTLIHLPGVLSLAEDKVPKLNSWPRLKIVVGRAVGDLAEMRQKEGRALFGFLKTRAETLKSSLAAIKARLKKAVKDRLEQIKTEEERSSFLKDTDIAEEIERLTFHIQNFRNKLTKRGPVGKELDFIAQEMQREANTLGAKTFDTTISAKVVQIKSQIEKIREQVQNIE
ncbi:MAG: YicC/YloC family endoribonuclease [Candidatus Omnitrophota bacterium]